jgi:hypothetical protein
MFRALLCPSSGVQEECPKHVELNKREIKEYFKKILKTGASRWTLFNVVIVHKLVY